MFTRIDGDKLKMQIVGIEQLLFKNVFKKAKYS